MEYSFTLNLRCQLIGCWLEKRITSLKDFRFEEILKRLRRPSPTFCCFWWSKTSGLIQEFSKNHQNNYDETGVQMSLTMIFLKWNLHKWLYNKDHCFDIAIGWCVRMHSWDLSCYFALDKYHRAHRWCLDSCSGQRLRQKRLGHELKMIQLTFEVACLVLYFRGKLTSVIMSVGICRI